jgi:hypothetical protein
MKIGVLVMCVSASAAGAGETPLEPYLAGDFAGLVAQSRDAASHQVLRRHAMRRPVAIDPERAAEALVPLLNEPAGHLNEFAGALLFALGRPHSRTAELVRRMEAGRTHATKEQIVAFAQAVSWPGNVDALPTLRRMVAEKWDTALEAKLCIARIEDVGGPKPLLRLPEYESGTDGRGVDYARCVAELLRARQDARANEILLEGGRARPALALWDGIGVYALAWPGNRALATAYLKEAAPSPRLTLAAARTREEDCLRRVRREFEDRAAAWLGAGASQRNVLGFQLDPHRGRRGRGLGHGPDPRQAVRGHRGDAGGGGEGGRRPLQATERRPRRIAAREHLQGTLPPTEPSRPRDPDAVPG